MIRAARFIAAFAVCASAAHAQAWNTPRALGLVRRAVERRSGQISATTLASYSAKAKGYLTFLGQFGDSAIIRPRVIKQTQLAVDVYWRAPASSKQIVVGRRDTLLTPADIDYYGDRFGIVQSNFPDRIRLGDGNDVSDITHPLSSQGADLYDFAIVDSMSIRTGASDSINVFQVMFRPKDPRAALAIGSAYVDVSNADIARIDLTFTRAAILDKRIEHLTVSLENAFVEGRAWLPRRQEIEVVRTGTWMRFNVRGIIRGRWEIGDYNVQFSAPPTLFTGRPIVFASPQQLKNYPFKGGILDELPPDVAVLREEDIKHVQQQAEDMVKEEFRARAQRASLSVPHVSDLFRVTRAEGLALGAGGEMRVLPRVSLDARGRYGFSDEEWKGEVGLGVSFRHNRAIRAYASRDYADARDVAEVSGIRNSIAAQEFGSDYTDPFDVMRAGAQLTLGRFAGARWRVDVSGEEHDPVAVRATPERGRYEATIPARHVRGTRASVFGEGAIYSIAGGSLQTNLELRFTDYHARARVPNTTHAARLALDATYSRQIGKSELVTRTIAGAGSGGDVAPQLFVYFGGPTTAPGYAFDDFAARRGISQHVEWRTDVPFLPLSLGRYGRVPAHATLAPYVHAVWVDGPAQRPGFIPLDAPTGPVGTYFVRGDRQGWYPSIGVAIEPLLGVVRIDVARGLRDGRWTFSADIARIFWGML